MSNSEQIFHNTYNLFEKRYLEVHRGWKKSKLLQKDFANKGLYEQAFMAAIISVDEDRACNRIIEFQLGMLNELEWQEAEKEIGIRI